MDILEQLLLVGKSTKLMLETWKKYCSSWGF